MGGIAHVSQVQLLQTFVTLLFAWGLNREPISLAAWLVAAAVVMLVVTAQHTKVRKKL
jgi:drug/metabolite transporter (DMT)-like permease